MAACQESHLRDRRCSADLYLGQISRCRSGKCASRLPISWQPGTAAGPPCAPKTIRGDRKPSIGQAIVESPAGGLRRIPEDLQPVMPASDSHRRVQQAERLARLVRLVQTLARPGRWTIHCLAELLGVTPRTVYRYLNVLRLAGLHPQCEKGCYRIPKECFCPPPTLLLEEALDLALTVALARCPDLGIGTGAHHYVARLAEQAGLRLDVSELLDLARDLVVVRELKLADHSQYRHRKMLHEVLLALVQGHQLQGTYRTPYQKRAKRLRLHPYRLCLINQAWYLIAREHNGVQAVCLRIARFKSLKMLDVQAQVPSRFDVEEFFGRAWAVYRGEQRYRVRLRFAPDAAPLVQEVRWHPTQKVQPHADGSVTVQFDVDGLEEILWWVLSWSGRVEVLAPPELRRQVVEQLRQGLKLNEPSPA